MFHFILHECVSLENNVMKFSIENGPTHRKEVPINRLNLISQYKCICNKFYSKNNDIII
jgi:hypothetical protein